MVIPLLSFGHSTLPLAGFTVCTPVLYSTVQYSVYTGTVQYSTVCTPVQLEQPADLTEGEVESLLDEGLGQLLLLLLDQQVAHLCQLPDTA